MVIESGTSSDLLCHFLYKHVAAVLLTTDDDVLWAVLVPLPNPREPVGNLTRLGGTETVRFAISHPRNATVVRCSWKPTSVEKLHLSRGLTKTYCTNSRPCRDQSHPQWASHHTSCRCTARKRGLSSLAKMLHREDISFLNDLPVKPDLRRLTLDGAPSPFSVR